MKHTLFKIFRIAAILAIGVFLIWIAFKGVSFEDIKGLILNANYSWIILSIVFSIFAFVSRARRWSLLIEPISHRPGLWNTYNALLHGYLANYALPRLGEVTRCVVLNRKEKIPVDSLIGTVIIERAIDFISMLLIMVILLIAKAEEFGFFFKEYIFQPLGEKFSHLFGNALALWIILGILIIVGIAILVFFRARLSKLGLVQKLLGILKRISQGLLSVKNMKNKWEFLFHTLFIWTMYALMTWVVVFSLPEITGHLNFFDGIFLLVIGSMGMAVPVNAGIGAFHWMVSRGLMLVYELDKTEGLAFATLQHESQTLLVIILGTIATIALFNKSKKKNETPS